MPGVPLNITLPTIGVTTWPQWAVSINSALSTIITDLESSITTSEILENADHDFNGYGITDVRTINFRVGNLTTIPTPGIGFSSGEFTIVDEAGRSVQLTSGGALNYSGLGGFKGDYISASAQATYTAATSTYAFTDSAGTYSSVRADDVLVSNGSFAATIAYVGAANYTFTLPDSPPAAQALVSISAAGVLSTSATIGTAVTLSNANITLAGTSELKHPDIVESYPAAFMNYNSGTVGTVAPRTDGGVSVAAAAWTPFFRVPPARTGDRFKSLSVRVSKGGADVTTLSLYKVPATGTLPAAFATQNSAAATGAATITVTSTTTLAAGEYIVASLSFTATGTNIVYSLQPTWDRP